MKANPYLSFDGRSAEAMSFYQECLGGGGTLNIKLHGNPQTGESTSAEMVGKVMHAHLEIGGLVLMASDIPSQHYTVPSPMVQVMLLLPTDGEAETVFAALSENATIFMPLQQTDWASRFGMLKDKFGVPWMVSSESLPA